MHIHILGICGSFMGGLALIARTAGHRVTGCDSSVYPPMSAQLQAQGIALVEGWDAGQLDLAPDLFVVGNVVSRGNPLIEAILDRGLSYTSGPQWLAENVLPGKWVLAVAGTHGKTTTSAMLAWILDDAGLAPGFLIGGVPNDFGVSARLTDSDLFVIEADEYDTAFFDKRSKFVHYRPRTAILNNLEYDHADIFPDLAAIETQFHHLVRTVPRQGLLVVNGQSEALRRVLAHGSWTPVERFGTRDGWHAAAKQRQGCDAWEIRHADVAEGSLAWTLQGEHNTMNALAAIAAARHVGVRPAQALAALGRFTSVKRRMEVKGVVGGVTVYDDFAHHPTAIATTVAGLRNVIDKAAVGKAAVDKARVIAVIEPRSNTMKLGTIKAALARSLAAADLVFGYGARAGKDALGWNLGETLAPLGERARSFDDLDTLVDAVAASARPGDHVLVMSNGGFGGVHAKLLAALPGQKN